MGNLTLVKGNAEKPSAIPARPASEIRASYSALKLQPCGLFDAQKAIGIEKEKRQMLRELRSIITKGTEKERAEAISELAELMREGDFRPFVELAIPISFGIRKDMEQEEKKAVAALVATVAHASERSLAVSGFAEGVVGNLLDLTTRFQEFLFRNDFLLDAKTELFAQTTRALVKINPERALTILLNELNALNYECGQLLSSQALADGLEGDEMRFRVELLDAAAEIAKLDDVSPVFAEAVEREGEAFKKDVERRLQVADEVNKINPMACIVQIASMITLLREVQASLGTLDIFEAREIHDALANARALKKALDA